MAVPDYQSLMLPILERTADGKNHRISVLIQELSDLLHLSEEDRDQRLASGQRTIFNRTHWAVTYLVKTGLLARSARGTVCVTDRGRGVLAEKPGRVDVKYLSRYPELAAFRSGGRGTQGAVAEAPPHETRDEVLDATFGELRRSVEADLWGYNSASTIQLAAGRATGLAPAAVAARIADPGAAEPRPPALPAGPTSPWQSPEGVVTRGN